MNVVLQALDAPPVFMRTKALKALGDKKAEIRDGLPIPTLRPDYVTIRLKAVGMLVNTHSVHHKAS